MKISFLENGLDSLKKGSISLLKYEEIKVSDDESRLDKSRFYFLKDAILNIQHGIEILFKHLLLSHNELLIFSEIGTNVQQALKERRIRNYDSVFQTSFSNKIHTVTFTESVERLINICGITFSKRIKEKLSKIEGYRNQIIHSEIYFDEGDISELFDGFIDELDFFFYKWIGEEYLSITGYGDLKRNFEIYSEILLKNGQGIKNDVLAALVEILSETKIAVGLNEVRRVTDINKATNFISAIFSKKFQFGLDLYNNYSSGDIRSINRLDDEHFAIHAGDMDCKFVFKFKSLIIAMSSVFDDHSPMIFFECDNDEILIAKSELSEASYGILMLESVYDRKSNQNYIGSSQKHTFMTEVIDNYYDNEIQPDYENQFQFLTKGIFCYINIQRLGYEAGSFILNKFRNVEGESFEIELRKIMNK